MCYFYKLILVFTVLEYFWFQFDKKTEKDFI